MYISICICVYVYALKQTCYGRLIFVFRRLQHVWQETVQLITGQLHLGTM